MLGQRHLYVVVKYSKVLTFLYSNNGLLNFIAQQIVLLAIMVTFRPSKARINLDNLFFNTYFVGIKTKEQFDACVRQCVIFRLFSY